MQRVLAKAPTRVDIGGGTLDMTSLHHILVNPITINLGVTLDAEAEVALAGDGRFHLVSEDQNQIFSGNFAEACASTKLPLLGLLLRLLWEPSLPALKVTTRAKSPAGAGLGGSSCLSVALMGALRRMRAVVGSPLPPVSDEKFVQTVQDVETGLIHAPTGCQDYWGALRGNLNLITYPPGGAQVETLVAKNNKALEEKMLLCYTGKSRASSGNNWKIFRAAFENDKTVIGHLNQIASFTGAMAQAARQGNWDEVIALSAREWDVRKNLWPDIVTPETVRIENAACEAGAVFGRLCGAGGGGVMAVFTDPENRDRVKAAVEAAGGSILKSKTAGYGLTVV